MQQTFEPFFNLCQGQLEVSRRCMDAVFSGAEKIDQVMIGATYRAFSTQLDLAKELMSASDLQSASNALQSRLLSRPGNALNDQNEIMRIMAEMQTNIGNSLRDYMDSIGYTPPAHTEKPHQNGSAVPFNPVSSMFTIWESAFKDAAASARQNMAAVQSAMETTQEAAGTAGTKRK